MKKLLIFLCLSAQSGFSQSNQIDSLKQELIHLDKQPDGYTKDTLRFNALKVIMRAYADVNIDSSAHYNALMIKLCVDSKLQKELIYAYQFAGYLYQVRGDYRQSIWYHYKALPLAEKLRQYSRIARSYSGLAHAYSSLKEYVKAGKLGRQGLAVLRKYPDATIQLSILNVFGEIHREQGELADALKVSQDMYKLARREHIQWYEAQGLHTIGWAYMKMGDTAKPLDYYKRALALARKIGSADLEESILLHIAEAYVQQKEWPTALAYCNGAKQMAIRLKNSSIVAEADENLYKIFKNTGQTAKALKAYESFILLKDSLSRQTNEQRTEMLQAQYDNVQKTNALQQLTQQMNLLDQKNRNLQLARTRNELFLVIVAILLIATLLLWNNRQLQAKNRELIQKNEEIKGALFKGQTIERKRVAIELHDNLSSLLSAVNMSIQAINPQNLSESEQSVYRNVKQLIQNAYSEVRNISHNILPAELEREGLAITLTTLVNRLNQNSPLQFSLTLTGLQERLPVEIEFNVYSIILELINNAIKHAKANTIGISLFRTDLGINLSVTDDGVGLGQNHDKRGVGLQNIQTRLDSLGGTFNTLLPTEKGTRILIKIPIETIRINGNVRIV